MSRTYSFDLASGRPILLLTITKPDGEVKRISSDAVDTVIGANTWTALAGLKVGDLTERADGTPPSISFEAVMASDGPFHPAQVDGGKFEGADIEIDLTNGKNPLVRDFYFVGKMIGTVDYDLAGVVTFECISKYGVPLDIFVRQYQLMCDADFGDIRRCKIPVLPADVARGEVLALGDARRKRTLANNDPADYENVYYEVTTAGTTHASVAPTYDPIVGNTTTDDTVVLTARNAWTRAVRIATASDTHNLVLDRDPDPRATADNTWFNPGTLLFRTGWNAGRRYKLGKWVGATRTITSFAPMGTLVAVNDWAEISPDCDHTIDMCVAKYANANNHRGFPYQAGAKAQAMQLGFS